MSTSLKLNTNKPRVIVAPDGQWAEILSTANNIPVNLNKDGIHLNGIRFKGFRLGSVVVTGDLYHRQSMRRIEFNDCTGDPTVSNNESGWLIFSTSNSTKRNYIWASQITYVNCHEICAFDWYSVGPGLFDRSTWTTNQAIIEEPIWFPKASCDIDMRHLTFDNVTIDFDASVFGVIHVGSNSAYAPATCHVHHCFIRTKFGSHNMVAYNVSGLAVSTENYDEHNTYIGGRVFARNIDGDDMVNFDRVVIVNDAGGVTMPDGGATIANSLTGTSGIVDSNGRLTDSNRGLIGFQIYPG